MRKFEQTQIEPLFSTVGGKQFLFSPENSYILFDLGEWWLLYPFISVDKGREIWGIFRFNLWTEMELIFRHSCRVGVSVSFHLWSPPLGLFLFSSGSSSLHEWSCPKPNACCIGGIYNLPSSFYIEAKDIFNSSKIFAPLGIIYDWQSNKSNRI